MKYSVIYTKQAQKSLNKLDRSIGAMIVSWIDKNLEGSEDPRQHGTGLTANRSGQWRYRVGDYRILADIQDNEIVIVVVAVAHRREVYRCNSLDENIQDTKELIQHQDVIKPFVKSKEPER